MSRKRNPRVVMRELIDYTRGIRYRIDEVEQMARRRLAELEHQA